MHARVVQEFSCTHIHSLKHANAYAKQFHANIRENACLEHLKEIGRAYTRKCRAGAYLVVDANDFEDLQLSQQASAPRNGEWCAPRRCVNMFCVCESHRLVRVCPCRQIGAGKRSEMPG